MRLFDGFCKFYITLSQQLLVNLKIDDVVDASPVHLGCGIWGAIATTFLCNPKTFRDSFSTITNVDNGYGIFYDVS